MATPIQTQEAGQESEINSPEEGQDPREAGEVPGAGTAKRKQPQLRWDRRERRMRERVAPTLKMVTRKMMQRVTGKTGMKMQMMKILIKMMVMTTMDDDDDKGNDRDENDDSEETDGQEGDEDDEDERDNMVMRKGRWCWSR